MGQQYSLYTFIVDPHDHRMWDVQYTLNDITIKVIMPTTPQGPIIVGANYVGKPTVITLAKVGTNPTGSNIYETVSWNVPTVRVGNTSKCICVTCGAYAECLAISAEKPMINKYGSTEGHVYNTLAICHTCGPLFFDEKRLFQEVQLRAPLITPLKNLVLEYLGTMVSHIEAIPQTQVTKRKSMRSTRAYM